MRKRTLAVIGLTCMMTLAACNNGEATGDDTPVAVVDNKEFTESEFVDTLKDRYGEALLEELISFHLIDQASENVEVTDEEIEEELDNFRKNFGVEDDEDLLNMIEEQVGLQLDSIDDLKEKYIIPPLVVQKLAVADVNVTEEQKEEYFEENKEQFGRQIEASHILVEDKDTAEDLLQQLKDGADFAELAKEHSIDGSAANGGELGYFGQGKMVAPFEEAAFSLPLNELSDLVKSEFGYHIIIVTGEKETYEDYEAEIEEILIQEQSKSADEVLEELIDNAKVEIKDPRFSNLFK